MDPLSISSGIAGLLYLAVSIAQVSIEYVSCVRDARKAINDLTKELTCLEEVLKSIRNELLLEPEIMQIRAQQIEDRWSGRDALLQECEKDLCALWQELQNKVKVKKIKIVDRALWYFNEDAMKDRIRMLCRYRDQFTALTSQDILAVGILTLKEVRDWRQEEFNQKILHWLSPLDFAARHQDLSSKRQPDTLRWLLASAEYRTWNRSDIPLIYDHRVMWCSGEPGAGKTYASSKVLDHLFETSKINKPGIAYVYCDYDDQNNQTLSNILGCILKQITMQCAALPGFIGELYKKDGHKPIKLETEIFWELLERLTKMFPRTYIIVDALDELENDTLKTRRNLLRMMSMDRESKSDVRIFATSRPHLEDINKALCAFPKLLIEARDNDMHSFLLQRIEGSEDLEDIVNNDKDFKVEIIETLIEKANKLFLIPALHIDRLLESTSRAEIEETLENITGTIGDAYASTLRRIQNLPERHRDLALNTLMWLSHSKRPLRFAELQEALAVQIGSKNINHKAYVSAKIILSTCLGLINIERGTEVVRLMHPTLEEYLKSSQSLFDNPAVKISRILLTYMLFPEPRQWLENEIDAGKRVFPEDFVESSNMRELEPDILEYFRSRPYVLFSPLEHHGPWFYTSHLIRDLFRDLRKHSTSESWIELVYATFNLFGDVVLQLIKRGVAFQAVHEVLSLPTALSWLSMVCSDMMMGGYAIQSRIWIELDKFLQNVLKQGLTAKLDSSEQDTLAQLLPYVSVETMDIFLDCGFDVNRPCTPEFGSPRFRIERRGYTLIHIAAHALATMAIKILGQNGVDCNKKTQKISLFRALRQSLLQIMIERLDCDVYVDHSALEALLQAGFNARESFDDNMGSTALHLAMRHGIFNEPLYKLLTVHDAQISAINNRLATPLRSWASNGPCRPWSFDDLICDDWRRGRWLLRHGASLSELGNARCPRPSMKGVACICREWMRVLACGWGEDDKVKLQDAIHEFERRQEEWLCTYEVFDDPPCGKVLLDWLVEEPHDEDSPSEMYASMIR
ncbi:hypothetical protein MMC17_007350 [Xylographa soralifera]|nr:hypothetical protein [Xylographa soralifera]